MEVIECLNVSVSCQTCVKIHHSICNLSNIHFTNDYLIFICSCLVKYFTIDLNNMQAEGIFRINADNRQEEYLRDQLNKGVVAEDIDVHCLAGLIKVLQ